MPGMPIVKPVGFHMPGMQGMKLHAQHLHIKKKSPNFSQGSLKLRVSCLAINVDFNKKKVMFVIMYVTGSTDKTEDR